MPLVIKQRLIFFVRCCRFKRCE